MTTVHLTMAQALVRFLDNQYIEIDGKSSKFIEGIWGIFGHGNVTGLGEALENEQHDLRFIQGHNEQGMVHAATAFAKQHNRQKIMACTTSIGPGALNLVTGAGTATTNRLPVLLLPGDIFACRQPDPVLQQLEHSMDYTISVNDCLKPVSQFWDRISRPEQLMTSCLQAMQVLTNPAQTGAVTLCLPQDVQAESYDYPEEFFAKRVHRVYRTEASTDAIDSLAQAIIQAQSPFIIAGGGVKYSGAEKALAALSEQFGIPVAVTQAGKGCMLDSHPMNVGGLGVTGTQMANRLASEADCVLSVGCRLSDFTTASKSAFQNPDIKLFNLNVQGLDGIKMNGSWVPSDAKLGLEKLSKHLIQRGYQFSRQYQASIEDLKAMWSLEVEKVLNQPCEGNSQMAVLGALNEFVGPDDVVVCAAGSLPGDLHRFWQVKGLGTYHVEYAFSCMGYEVAGGLGVKLANPKGDVYVVVGDGSFLMMHSELLTSLQENEKINVIVFDNQGYQCIQGLQKSQGSNGFGNDFKKPVMFSKIAQGLGVESYEAKNLLGFKQALNQAKQADGSTLIEVKVSPTSMSHGYDSWWRVGVAQTSNSSEVTYAHQTMKEKIKKTKPY